MSKLPAAKVIERREIFCESLEQWIEIAVFDEDYLRQAVISQLDLTDMELDVYRYELLKKWPGIGHMARLQMSLDPGVLKEVYDLIVKYNPSLHPRNVINLKGISDTLVEQHSQIQQWFASRGQEGQAPEVLQHGA